MGSRKDSKNRGGSALLPGLLGLAVLGGLGSAFDVFGSAASESREHESTTSTSDEPKDQEKELARDTKRWLERVRPSRPAASDIVRR